MQAVPEPGLVTLDDGREVLVRGIVPGDFPGVSELATDNFRHAHNFAQLDDAARQA